MPNSVATVLNSAATVLNSAATVLNSAATVLNSAATVQNKVIFRILSRFAFFTNQTCNGNKYARHNK